MQECRSCGIAKEFKDFAKDENKPNGVSTECKSCTAARARASRRGITCTKKRWDNRWECVTCKVIKELNIDNFFPVKQRTTSFDTMCRDCRNAYHRANRRANYYKNGDKHRARNREIHRNIKIKCIEYLGSECEDCGIVYDKTNAMIFDFHHKDPNEKEFQLLTKGKQWETNKPELDKCALLCANCHRKAHANEAY